jgi:hypothetical protein
LPKRSVPVSTGKHPSDAGTATDAVAGEAALPSPHGAPAAGKIGRSQDTMKIFAAAPGAPPMCQARLKLFTFIHEAAMLTCFGASENRCRQEPQKSAKFHANDTGSPPTVPRQTRKIDVQTITCGTDGAAASILP